jgi:hypothetical protein
MADEAVLMLVSSIWLFVAPRTFGAGAYKVLTFASLTAHPAM